MNLVSPAQLFTDEISKQVEDLEKISPQLLLDL